MDGRLTITDVAKYLGITPRTIMRWEKSGKIKRCKRDWRGWRFYTKEDLEEIRKFFESIYEYNEAERTVVSPAKDLIAGLLILAAASLTYIICAPYAQATEAEAQTQASAQAVGIIERGKTVDIMLDHLPAVNTPESPMKESLQYTLGPDDVIAIEVRRHPEFSGEYTVNSEGKIEYKYIGDVIVSGLTKNKLKERLTEILSEFLLNPDVDIRIVAYLSKVFYVVGDVNRPGKFYMKGDEITVREALIQSGLPTHAAAMRRSRIITPNDNGKNNFKNINVYALLYEGDLSQNLKMRSGEVLYVPATVMAKIIRIISPVTDAIGTVTGSAREGAGAAAVAAAAL